MFIRKTRRQCLDKNQNSSKNKALGKFDNEQPQPSGESAEQSSFSKNLDKLRYRLQFAGISTQSIPCQFMTISGIRRCKIMRCYHKRLLCMNRE